MIAPSRKRNPGKAQARNRCIALMRKIQKLEREGKSGYPDWRETKSKLDVALRDYRSSGASPTEMFSLGPEEPTIVPRGKRNPTKKTPRKNPAPDRLRSLDKLTRV